MKKILFYVLLTVIHIGIVQASDSLLVAHWPMDDGSDTVVTDVISGNNGALVGLDASTAWLAGGGVQFDNMDGHHIEVPQADTFDFGNESFTISMLVRYQSPPLDTDRWIIKGTHSAPGTGSRYEVFHTEGMTVRFAIDNGPADIKSRVEVPNTVFVTGDWVHVVAVRDTSNDLLSIYANGLLQGSEADNSGDISSGESMWIGESTDETGTAMSGDIRDVRLYNYALGDSDIDTLFQSYDILGTDAYLSAIALDPNAELSPVFSSEVFNYTAVLPAGTDSVVVSVQKSDLNATVTGEDTVDVSSGSGVATIVVTAENELTRNTYTITFITGTPKPRQLAFPGAEGSGRFATGGRFGDVYEVTNLNNSGPGSIVDAVSSGNRTIVFRVSGTIALEEVNLSPKPNTTIAGQTAPGDGICIKGHIDIDASNVIIRHLRVRVDRGEANNNGDAVSIGSGKNIIVDHVSASYARDETISSGDGADSVTVQWCIISEALTWQDHSYGSLIRGNFGDQSTYHHNLYAHIHNRQPRPGNYTTVSEDTIGLFLDWRNNVIYNWAGDRPGYNDDSESKSRYNFIGNVYIQGQESSGNKIFRDRSPYNIGYFEDNSYDGVVPSDPWSLVEWRDNYTPAMIEAYKARSYKLPMEPVTTTSPAQAKTDVLAFAGASVPKRDTIDRRIVNDVLNKTGHSIATTADQPEGAWPLLNPLPAPPDDDHDGMPNDWENKMGLNPNDPTDRNIIANDGYTMLEKYMNSIEFTKKVEGIALTVTSENNLKISWADCFMSEDGYIIERAEASGEFVLLDSVGPNTNFYVDGSALLSSAYRYRVKAFNATNESLYSDEVSYDPVSVADLQIVTGLFKIYPNPAGDVAYIEFQLNEGTKVDISIVDMNGMVIRSLTNRFYSPGSHSISWNVSDDAGFTMKPGIYVCTFKTSNGFKAQKFTVLSD